MLLGTTVIWQTQTNFYNLSWARMMELVDMRGLKPRPTRGPGSTPGMGIKWFGFCALPVGF